MELDKRRKEKASHCMETKRGSKKRAVGCSCYRLTRYRHVAASAEAEPDSNNIPN